MSNNEVTSAFEIQYSVFDIVIFLPSPRPRRVSRRGPCAVPVFSVYHFEKSVPVLLLKAAPLCAYTARALTTRPVFAAIGFR